MKPLLIGILAAWGTASAIENPNVRVTILEPVSFGISLTPTNTNCATLDQLIQKYIKDDCGTNPVSVTRCIMDQNRIMAEAKNDPTMRNGNLDFVAQYQVDAFSKVTPAPSNPTRLFDETYLYSAVMLYSQDSSLKIETPTSDIRIGLSEKFNLPSGLQMINQNGHSIIETNNRLYACALEAGAISLSTQANLDITSSHPQDQLRHEIISSLYTRAHELSKTNQSLAAKQFLLGVTVADVFHNKNYSFTNHHELDEVALSAYHILIKNQAFELNSNHDDSEMAAQDLLTPQPSLFGVTVKLKIK